MVNSVGETKLPPLYPNPKFDYVGFQVFELLLFH